MTEIEIVVGYSRGTKSIEWIYIIKDGLHDTWCVVQQCLSTYWRGWEPSCSNYKNGCLSRLTWHWRPERFLESHGEVPEAELWRQWKMAAAALTSKGQRQADKEPLLVGTIRSSGGFLLYLPFRIITLNLSSGMSLSWLQSIDNQKSHRITF